MKADTLAIHGGFEGDTNNGAMAVPIWQTVSYSYKSAQELADVFEGKAPGYVYTRIANPTTAVLETRLTALENGIGCIATSSGMAAIASVAAGLLKSGDEIVSAAGIFGGTLSLFKNTLGRFGIKTKLVQAGQKHEFVKAIGKKTRLVFVETIGNPRMDVPDIQAIAEIAHRANIPLIVDNTVTTPLLIKPGRFGADIVVHSTSKFINGHGTAIGGAIIDTGNFNWSKGPFEEIRKLSKKARQLAFLAYLRNLVYRDLGGCPAPMNSFLMLQGLETLPARMVKHCANAEKLAKFLLQNPNIRWVKYPGLTDNEFHGRIVTQFGGFGGAILTLGLGSREKAFKLIDSLRLAKNSANIGDVRTLVIHPSSTIFHEFGESELNKMGITKDMIRVSVGIEDFDDIKNDFEQAINNTYGSKI